MSEIRISPRTQGMVDASANYYQESRIFRAIQNTQALEYDRIYEGNEDLDLQLSPYTATWGLVFWEAAVGISPKSNGDYEARRPLILAKMLGDQNFGAGTIKELAANYGEEVAVFVDYAAATVNLTFGQGMLNHWREFDSVIKELIHAHLALEYDFSFLNRFWNKETLSFYNLYIALAFFNYGSKRPIVLDGEYVIDGAWLLNQGFRGLELSMLKIGTAIVRQRNSLSGSVIMDSMYKIDGSEILDGTRKLNANIVMEAI